MPKTDKELTDAIVNKAMTKIRDRKPASTTDLPIFDDDAVTELANRDVCDHNCAMLTPAERDALCQTVRALRAENERLKQGEQERIFAVRYLVRQGYERCTDPDHGCEAWHERLT